MVMSKTKCLEKVWVGFDQYYQKGKAVTVSKTRPDNIYLRFKRYRLDRGNEVARALNVLDEGRYLRCFAPSH